MGQSKFNKVAIISHYDTTRKEVELSGSPRRDAMMRDLHLWTHLELNGTLVEELHMLSDHVLENKRDLTIWDLPSYSSIYLHSAIKAFDENVDIKIFDVIEERPDTNPLQAISEYSPDLIFISTTFTLRLAHLTQLLNKLRKSLPDASLCVGGHFIYKELHYADDPKDILSQIGDDVQIIASLYGETEISSILSENGAIVPDILTSAEQKESEDRRFAESRVHYGGYPFKMSVAPVRTSIGCPFNCAFCSYHEMAGHYRMRDINNIITELKELDRLGIEHVVFIDDTLNMPKKRFSELLDLMLANDLTHFNCYSFCRCQFIDDAIAGKMAKCGFQSVLLGIESGSEKILQNMNKKASPDEYLQGIAKLKQNNILTFCAIIFGFPGETEETIQKSIDFINNSNVDYVYIQPYFCLHNSPVYKDREKYGLSGEGAIWKHDTMTSTECNAMVKKAFSSITGATHTHMENTMWEYVYFKVIGFTDEDYKAYRTAINSLRETIVNPDSHEPDFTTRQLTRLRELTGPILV